jgi:hypothetical protein
VSYANSTQIKNAVKAAGAIAKYEEDYLTLTHIELAIQGRQDFELDIKGAGTAEGSGMFS